MAKQWTKKKAEAAAEPAKSPMHYDEKAKPAGKRKKKIPLHDNPRSGED